MLISIHCIWCDVVCGRSLNMRNSPPVSSFKRNLKTHYFAANSF